MARDFRSWLLSAADHDGRMRGDHRLVHARYLADAYPWTDGSGELPSAVNDPQATQQALQELEGSGFIRREDGPERDIYSGRPLLMIQVENWESVRPTRAPIPDDVRLTVYERDDYRCAHCGTAEDLSIDHIRPWSKGGTDDVENLQTLCRPCNSAKGDKWDDEARKAHI